MVQAKGPRGFGLVYRLVRAVLRPLLQGFFRVRIEGLQNLPAEGAAVVAGNHPSVLDGLLLLVLLPRPVRFLVSDQMFLHPILRPLCEAMQCIPVFKKQKHNGDSLRAALGVLDAGGVLGIFPEGTTLEGGELRTLRPGVALLALERGAPVVPFGVAGAREALPPGHLVPRPGALALCFGRPLQWARVEARPVPDQAVQKTLAELQQAVRAQMTRAEGALDELRQLPLNPLKVALSGAVVVPLSAGLLLTL